MPDGLFQIGTLNSVVVGVASGFAVSVFQAWRGGQDRRRTQRLAIFNDLMAMRAQTLHVRYVEAFNSVPVAFYGESEVIDKWRECFGHVNNGTLSLEA